MSIQSTIDDYKRKRSFWKFRRRIDNTADMLFDNALNFFMFCVISIISVLLFYSITQDDVTSSVALGLLWILFWRRSKTTGKVFLIFSAFVGMIHEIIGVQLGWFTYATGMVYGVPLWVFFGYGVMFWSCENLWRSAEREHLFSPRRFKQIFVGLVALIAVLDLTVLATPSGGWFDVAYFILIMGLFIGNRREQHLALTTGFLTGLDEVLGEIVGAWYHGSYQYAKFSLIELIPSYVFCLWMALVLVHSMLGTRKISRRELAIGFLAFMLRFGLSIPSYLAYQGLL